MPPLCFANPALEKAFELRRNQQLVREDSAWALAWLLLFCVGLVKSYLLKRGLPWIQVLLLAAWVVWCPLLIWLGRYRRGWYVRHRSPLVCTLRMCRMLSVMNSHVQQREAQFVGSTDCVPSAPLQIFMHLSWKVNSLFFGAVAFVTPLRFHLPLQFFFLLLKLCSNGARCRLECGVPAARGWQARAAAGSCTMPLAAFLPGPAGATTAATAAGPAAADRYYRTAAGWIRRAVPLAGGASAMGRALPASWRSGRGGCLGRCFAVHGWLQAVGGMLLPLALLWWVEECLRARELRTLRQGRRQDEGGAGVAWLHSGGVADCLPERPLSLGFLAGWLAASAVLLWLLMEALLI